MLKLARDNGFEPDERSRGPADDTHHIARVL
jgi:hypothetical protein